MQLKQTVLITDSSEEDSEMDFEEPKPWKETPYNNSDNEPTGVTLKSKSKIFISNARKIVGLLKKRMKIYKVNDTSIQIIRHIYKKGALCSEIEVEDKTGCKALVQATIFQPKNSIEIRRQPDVSQSFVDQLRDVLVCFLEKFMLGASEKEIIAWSGKFSKPIPLKTAISSCTLCDYETKSKVALKRHYTIVHTEKLAKNKSMLLKCATCEMLCETPEGLKKHIEICHEVLKPDENEKLRKRITELESIVSQLKKQQTDDQPSPEEKTKEIEVDIEEMEESFQDSPANQSTNGEQTVDKKVSIPSHLKPVNPAHAPLLRGLYMCADAVGNGACGTNCGSMHMMEDDSVKAMMAMKRKINHHMADNMDIYIDMIGLPYTETLGGELEPVTCKTKEELINFLRSEKSLKVYSNMQEMQAMANIFNISIEVFTYGTRVRLSGEQYQVAEWMDPINPMPEAANLAEYKKGVLFYYVLVSFK